MSGLLRGPRAHSVAWVMHDDWIDGTVTCHAVEGADCRLMCREDCEAWSVTDHEHTLFDAGKCLVVEWIENTGVLESHIGTHEPTDGFIDTEFDGDAYTWWYSEVDA